MRFNLLNVCCILFLLTSLSCINDHSVPSATEEKTKLLLRNWRMLEVENGVDSLNGIAKSTLLFSENGALRTQSIFKDGNAYTENKAWMWHPTQPDWILVTRVGQSTFDPQNYRIIRKLTSDTLKITEGNFKFTFVPEL